MCLRCIHWIPECILVCYYGQAPTSTLSPSIIPKGTFHNIITLFCLLSLLIPRFFIYLFVVLSFLCCRALWNNLPENPKGKQLEMRISNRRNLQPKQFLWRVATLNERRALFGSVLLPVFFFVVMNVVQNVYTDAFESILMPRCDGTPV